MNKNPNTAKNKPQVSVITVCYNSEHAIEKTLISVTGQVYENIEYIIIDGGSTDKTNEIIQKYRDQIDLWISEKDEGIYDAMNKAVALAKGEWINFMNAGDTFRDNQVIKDIFDKTRTLGEQVIYGKSINIYPTFTQKGTILKPDQMWKAMPINHQAMFMKTKVLQKYGFDQKYRFAADYDLIMRLKTDHISFIFIDQFISMVDCIDSTSVKNILQSISERKEIATRNGSNLKIRLYYFLLVSRIKLFRVVKKMIPASWTNRIVKLRHYKTQFVPR